MATNAAESCCIYHDTHASRISTMLSLPSVVVVFALSCRWAVYHAQSCTTPSPGKRRIDATVKTPIIPGSFHNVCGVAAGSAKVAGSCFLTTSKPFLSLHNPLKVCIHPYNYCPRGLVLTDRTPKWLLDSLVSPVCFFLYMGNPSKQKRSKP